MITQHRNWKWFLRCVNDIDVDLHNKLVNNNYVITEKEKTLLLSCYTVNGAFGDILVELLGL
jgi:hypothetical protein